MLSCDLDADRDRMELVREIAALLNSGGGTIVVGARKNGDAAGLAPDLVAKLAKQAIEDVADGYLRPDRVEVTVGVSTTTTDVAGDERTIVEIGVPAIAEPPVVLAQAGRYQDAAGETHEVFGAQSVVVRRNGRTETAVRGDHLRWRAEAIDSVRREINERLAMVIAAPADAKVRVVTDTEVRDEPSYFLSRSTELFRLQSDQLLSGQDLVYLWLHRSTLQLDGAAGALIVQSALRKRATLYLWLSVLPLATDEIRTLLFEALAMKDRDKSDAAKAMLLVCALYLDAADYEQLAAALAASSYAHMREAVATLPDIEHARALLKGERLISTGQAQLVEETDLELLDQVDELLGRSGSASRRVPSLGLELLSRRLERRRLEVVE